PIAFIGGSLVAHGGQNPLEAVRIGSPVLFGPHTVNFEETTARLQRLGAALQVEDADDLVDALRRLLTDESALASMTKHAEEASDHEHAVLEKILEALAPLLDRRIGSAPPFDPIDSAVDARA
ncbi:MAG: 3-deoxy-D-manno-octulosonic acid transferase, partial [Geminicoccaceae bacterium]